jgi:hypothetical protein
VTQSPADSESGSPADRDCYRDGVPRQLECHARLARRVAGGGQGVPVGEARAAARARGHGPVISHVLSVTVITVSDRDDVL